MGLGSYFKADKPQPPESSPTPVEAPRNEASGQHRRGRSSVSEKRAPVGSPGSGPGGGEGLRAPQPRYQSRSVSVSGRSTRSTGSSVVLDGIKHEVMVNYLYQQQCSHLWVSDGSGEIEGVLLRKARGQYMACPPQLGSSPFALACATLNVQASFSPA